MRGQQVQGLWTTRQLPWHINLKELEAARLSLHELMREGDMVQLYMDSLVAVAFVNRQGGTRSRILCASALSLWQEVLNKKGCIVASWLPREYKEQADFLPKHKIKVWDFGLQPDVVGMLWQLSFWPTMDLFASAAAPTTTSPADRTTKHADWTLLLWIHGQITATPSDQYPSSPSVSPR